MNFQKLTSNQLVSVTSKSICIDKNDSCKLNHKIMKNSIRSIHRGINSKQRAIERYEKTFCIKASVTEKARICSEYYGFYFKF